MELNGGNKQTLDAALTAFTDELRAGADDESAVTLAYTHSLHRMWRTALRMLPLSEGWSVLDVGSGLGILAFELTANLRLYVQGLDIDPRFVKHSVDCSLDWTGRTCSPRGPLSSSAKVTFGASHSMLLFRHRFHPRASAVPTRSGAGPQRTPPGGTAGGIRLRERYRRPVAHDLAGTQPLSGPAGRRRSDYPARKGAVTANGGRKLSTYLRQAGFDITSVVVLPEAQHRVVDREDGERSLSAGAAAGRSGRGSWPRAP